MTDGEVATIFTKATGFMIDAEQPDLIGFARAIEKESSRSALEEAAKVCDSVNNFDNPMTASECADAIRALSQQDPQ